MKKDISVSVEASSYDLGQGLRTFVGHAKQALKDGWQTGQDVPALVMAAYTDLFSKAAAVAQLGADLEADKVAFIRGFAEAGFDIAADLSAPAPVVPL